MMMTTMMTVIDYDYDDDDGDGDGDAEHDHEAPESAQKWSKVVQMLPI